MSTVVLPWPPPPHSFIEEVNRLMMMVMVKKKSISSNGISIRTTTTAMSVCALFSIWIEKEKKMKRCQWMPDKKICVCERAHNIIQCGQLIRERWSRWPSNCSTWQRFMIGKNFKNKGWLASLCFPAVFQGATVFLFCCCCCHWSVWKWSLKVKFGSFNSMRRRWIARDKRWKRWFIVISRFERRIRMEGDNKRNGKRCVPVNLASTSFFCIFFSITFGADFFHSGQFPTEANPNLRKSVFLTTRYLLDV